MKKSILTILSILVVIASINVSEAKVKATSPETAAAIKLYKGGDYTQSYTQFSKIIEAQPENALAQYYYAMSSAQLGKKDEAVDGYERVITLSPNGVLGKYAKKGKKCIEEPFRCNEPETAEQDKNDTDEDKFIKGVFGGFSKQAQSFYEKQKIENMKREINRQDDITPAKFKEYKDFSSQAPSDEEIVTAVRTLQKAGMLDVMGTNRNNADLLYMLGLQNGVSGYNNSVDSRLIQSLLTTQMTANF